MGWGGDMQWTQWSRHYSGTKMVMTSCFMWFLKAWNTAWLITIGREKWCLFGSVIRSVCFSVVWSSWCQVDRLSLGSTVVSSPGKSLFLLRVPFLVITDFLPLSFLARGNCHYRNLSLSMSIIEFKTLEPKRQHCGVSQFTELVQRNSNHLSQGKSL